MLETQLRNPTLGYPEGLARWRRRPVSAAILAAIAMIALAGPSSSAADLGSDKIIDPSRVNVAAKQTELGADAAKLFDYVRTGIRNEPYQGLLRGAQGTLVAQAGNSVDKSLLLYELLKKAGIEARFVHGRLDDAQAARLLDSILAEPSLPTGEAPKEAAQRLIDAVAASMTVNYRQLLHAFSEAGFKFVSPASLTRAALLEALEEHYWLQYFDGANWIDLDPSFPTGARGEKFAAVSGTADALPAELFHYVTIRVVLEEKKDAGLQRRTLLTFRSTASDVTGQTLYLAHVNASWERPVPMFAVAGAANSALAGMTRPTIEDRVKPVLTIGTKYVVGEPFDIAAPQHEVSGGGQPIHGLGDLAAAIGDPPPITAIGEWIELEFLSPDGTIETTERTIFDRVGFAARQSGTVQVSAAPLGLNHPVGAIFAISLFSGPLADPAVRIASGRQPAPVGIGADASAIELGRVLEALNDVVVMISDGLASPLRATNLQAPFSYMSPRVVISTFRSTPDQVQLSIDLRRSDLRPMVAGDIAFRALMLRGILDGVVESEIMDRLTSAGRQSPAGPAAVSYSTSNVFRRAGETGIESILITDEKQIAFADEPAQRIASSLRQGLIVVAPQRSVEIDGQPRVAWWSVDPKTGRTIAETEAGLHGDDIEYFIIVNKDTDMASVFVRWPGAKNFVLSGPANSYMYEELATIVQAWGRAWYVFIQ